MLLKIVGEPLAADFFDDLPHPVAADTIFPTFARIEN
jgi:hypothetical protein